MSPALMEPVRPKWPRGLAQTACLCGAVAMASCGCENDPAPVQPHSSLSTGQTRAPDPGPDTPAIISPLPDDWFEDVTSAAGVDFVYRNGREAGRFYFIESFGGGVAMIDFDGDGYIDLFFTGGGTISQEQPGKIAGLSSALFRNQGDWQFHDVTAAAELGAPPDYSQGCAITDFNSDGLPDVFVCCYGRSRLYSNQGDGTFAEALPALPLPAGDWATAAAFGDIDRDGLPDLFLVHYTDWSPERDVEWHSPRGVRDLCGPSCYAGTACQLLHNSGDGKFDDWTVRVGMHGDVRGLGVVAADLNGDGLVDFYVASDETPKQLYLGEAGGRFNECAATAGVAVGEIGQPDGSMGVDVGDYNGDGLPDIFVTNFENEDYALYRNLGGGLFLHATVAAGLSGHGRARSGFGTAFADFDGDGWLDIFVLNGNPIYEIMETPYKQEPQLYHNLAGRRFENISARGGTFFREPHAGRGSAVGDLDNDGRLDLVTSEVNDRARLLRNRLRGGNYFGVRLRATSGEPDATGARVTAQFSGRTLARFAVRGGGFFSQSDSRILFPLAETDTAAEVVVAWPGRKRELFGGLAPRRTHCLIEGRGTELHEPP